MAKRIFDMIIASLGLLVFAPVMLVLAVWIKLDSPGPVFFRQERVGRFGKIFRIHKFRTMTHQPQGKGLQITVGGDSRITKVGHFIRRNKLDEVAQLIDVLKGDMSLVGPRPEVPKYVAHYSPEMRERVLSVRPGITDPASLAFRNENDLLARASDPEREYVEVILPKKLHLAADYVEKASFWTDIRLIAQTARILVS
ncbi:MAG: sugar transferase [Cellvibrionaceae bacterium]|nr:sugar transferase [Cellvibrionaceae bacterium]